MTSLKWYISDWRREVCSCRPSTDIKLEIECATRTHTQLEDIHMKQKLKPYLLW